MFRIPQALLVAAILFGVSADVQAADTGTLSLQVPLLKSKAKANGIKFSPYKSGKEAFQVTIELFDADSGAPLLQQDGATPWSETFTVTSNTAAPSDPANGLLSEPSKIAGRTTVLLGSTLELPPDLLEGDVVFTTRLTTFKKGVAQTPFERSPPRPLGVSGIVHGQNLKPARVETEKLQVTGGAADGNVLTSDASGNATWQPFADVSGVTGTANRLAVFDSANTLGDSLIVQSAQQVTIETQLRVTSGLVSDTDIFAGNDVFANDDVVAADDIVAGGNVLGGALMSAFEVRGSSLVRSGSPSSATTAGDVVADDDLLADDDVIAGDDVFAGGSINANGGASLGGSLTVSGSANVSGSLGTSSAFTATSDINTKNGSVTAGSPSSAFAAGDVAATDDLVADDDALIGDDVIAGGHIQTGTPSISPSTGDVAATDDLIADDDIFLGGGLIVLDDANGSEQLEIRTDEDMVFQVNNDITGGANDEFRWNQAPPGLGGFVAMRLDKDGDLSIDGSYSSGGADLAEYFPTTTSMLKLKPGTLVALDPQLPEHVQRAELGQAELVLGVVPTAPGLLMGAGSVMGLQPELLRAADRAQEQDEFELSVALETQWRAVNNARVDRIAVALQGRVPVRVDLTGGVIAAGDRLGMSAQPGMAARYTGYGPVIGIAMEAFDGSAQQESIVVFLGLDHSPDASSGGGLGAADLLEGLAELERSQLFVGTAQFQPGQSRLVVQDGRLAADSLPVLTFYGNPGGSYWVSERGHGWFVVELEQPATDWLELGFSATP